MATQTRVPRSRDERIADRASELQGRCVHFTGFQTNARCAAGCLYDDVRLDHAPIEYRSRIGGGTYTATRSIPCLDRSNHGGATCAKREVPTEAEALPLAAREVDETDRMVGFMFTAREAILAQTKNKGGAGTVPCPQCGGTMQFSQASSNKHVHARCVTTPGCLAWME